jgi:hypothetical protein
MSVNSFDIETFLDKTFFVPYCVSFYFMGKKLSFYYDNSDIIFKAIMNIFQNDFDKEIIYIHNLKFDGTIIINSLSNYNVFKINAIIENKEFYLLSVEFVNKKLEFRCSYRLLPISLYKISLGFVENNIKIDYPYNFIKKENLF